MVLLIGALGLSVPTFITMIVLGSEVAGIAGAMSLGEDLAGCWVVTSKGGVKRGRLGSGGDTALLSSSRLGG